MSAFRRIMLNFVKTMVNCSLWFLAYGCEDLSSKVEQVFRPCSGLHGYSYRKHKFVLCLLLLLAAEL